MKRLTVLFTILCLRVASQATVHAAEETESPWSFDVTLYGLAAGLTGDVTARGVNADIDVGFDQIWDNLDFGAMGKVRVGYQRWSLTTDVIFMGLEASKQGISAALDQWVVEPTLGYQLLDNLEVLAGVRYNSIDGEIRGPGILPNPRIVTGRQDWWDPILGFHLQLPLPAGLRFNLRADVGGFGAGSDVTWQAFPYIAWHYASWGALQLGWRWVYTDYESGAGTSRFRYDVLTHGLQAGLLFRF